MKAGSPKPMICDTENSSPGRSHHNNNNRTHGTRTPPAQQQPVTPSKPKSSRSPTASPSKMQALAYAGAKFSDPPSPKVLPKPPTHWFSNGQKESRKQQTGSYDEMSSVLKVMLKVQA